VSACRRITNDTAGVLDGPTSLLAGLAASSIVGRQVSRVRALPGAPAWREPGPDCVEQAGFSLHSGVCIPGGRRQRQSLEWLCRYVARPALASERLSELPDGRLSYELRHHWSDRTRRLVFEPLAFLAKLAALVPPPRAHLVTYHGVLAPASSLRPAIVPAGRQRGGKTRPARRGSTAPRCGRHPWAELMRRVFGLDVLRCPSCGGRRRILAAITEARVVRAILASLGLPTEAEALPPARGPPELFDGA